MDLELITGIRLPEIDGTLPGPIHSLVNDNQGNLYFSDEINHRVVSLNPQGNLRWHRSGCGEAGGQFRYPKGLAQGNRVHLGESLPCIAVCDAWNRRVQFFGLSGDLLAEWTDAGGQPFVEPVDVKFRMGTGEPEESQGYWIILDRGAHTIHIFGADGEHLTRLGRPLPGQYGLKWASDLMISLEAAQDADAPGMTLFDPLYYPARLIGNPEDALFVWEPLDRAIKLLAGKNLLPFLLKPGQEFDCMDVSSSSALLWLPEERSLALCDLRGEIRERTACAARPVTADLSQNRVWLQGADSIFHLRLRHIFGPTQTPGSYRELQTNTELEAALFREDKDFRLASRTLILRLRCLRDLCKQAHQNADSPTPDWESCNNIRQRLASASHDVLTSAQQVTECLHAWSLLFLKIHCFRFLAEDSNVEDIPSPVHKICEEMAEPLCSEFLALHRLMDETAVIRTRHASCLEEEEPQQWTSPLLDAVEGTLENALRLVQVSVRSINPFLESYQSTAPENLHLSGWRHHATCSRPSLYFGRKPKLLPGLLREIGRIHVGGLAEDSPSGPYGLTSTTNGRIFVVLQHAHKILELDPEGRVLDREPCDRREKPQFLCIAADKKDRLWITECLRHRLRIHVPGTNEDRIISSGSDCLVPLRYPHGVCCADNGRILVADTGNNRILSVGESGEMEMIAGGVGQNHGQFRHPMAVFPGGPSMAAGIWVVDQRNHRLQKLDADGNYQQEVGRCGLGEGSLTLPHTATLLPDGSLLVAQHQFTRRLKLFSPDGKELGSTALDFSPGGMLLYSNRLLITEADGNDIRVYEVV